ncbi:MAG: hypothetical protein JXA30_20800 [Deltaproteobacteria bacterium]|nr:hypothetical protein [Deltaproteobacteria bacterium]
MFVRIVFCYSLLNSLTSATSCSSDLTDSLEGRACDTEHKCLEGYVCDRKQNLCVPLVAADSGNLDSDSGDAVSESGTINDGGGEDDASIKAGADAAEGDRPCGFEIRSSEAACPTRCDRCEDGVCYIECDEERKCRNAKITCPEGLACEVQCSRTQACEGAKIFCPAIFTCNVSCTAELGCRAAQVKCGSDGPCSLDCETGSDVCRDAELQCGRQACTASCGPGQPSPFVKNCRVSCSSHCEC